MTILIGLFFCVWAVVLGSTLLGAVLCVRYSRKSKSAQFRGGNFFPPITILKPLKNLDDGIRECIESFFNLEYPEYEFLICVCQESDDAVALVRELITKYPQSPARLLIGEAKIGFNPKVDNLKKGYDQAQYDWLLISDSNVRVEPDYLKTLASYIAPGVGLITSNIAGRDAGNFWGRLESMVLNTYYMRWGVLANAAGVPVTVGKAMLFQKPVADQFGGLHSVANFLAEDYIFGQYMKKLGLKTRVTHEPVHQFVGRQTLQSYCGRHLRWGRIRKAISLPNFLLELLINSFISGVLGGWALKQWLGVPIFAVFVLHMSLWLFCDLLMILEIEGALSPLDPVLWMIRELSAPFLWAAALFGNKVSWRGQKLAIQSQTRLIVPGMGDLGDQFSTSFPMGSSHQQSSNRGL